MTDMPVVSAYAELRGYKMVAKRFEDLTAEVMKVSTKRIYDIVWAWRGVLASYPPKYAGQPPKVWPEGEEGLAQRRGFFWAVKQGTVTFPYERTGHYGWSWRVRRNREIKASEGISYRLYNDVEDAEGKPYSVFVTGGMEEGQEQYQLHAGRWLAIRDVIDAIHEDFVTSIEEGVAMAARRGGL